MPPNAPRMKPSTCFIYAQPRGELRKELVACLRMARAKRWPRSEGEDRRGHMADMLSIHVRPPEIEDRQFPGHWEGDLIKGALNQSAVGTLVERHTRLLILVKLPHQPRNGGSRPAGFHGQTQRGGATHAKDLDL